MVSDKSIEQGEEVNIFTGPISQDMREFIHASIATGLRSATLTLQMINQANQEKRSGLPVKRILVRSLYYGIGSWLWVNLIVQIAVNFQ